MCFDPERKEICVGYGAGGRGLAILREDGTKVGDIGLDAHTESFQLEKNGPRILMNLPNSRKVAVVDRKTRTVVASWSTGQALANFAMVLDGQYRLFVVCRSPRPIRPRVILLNTLLVFRYNEAAG